MAKNRIKRPGYGKILDAWTAPENAGDPIGCLATSFTFSPVFFEEECLGRFLRMESDPVQDGAVYLVEREEKLAQIACASALVDQHHCKGRRNLRWDLIPARLPGGVLHAKISLLLWTQWVRLIVASANLTEDGYRRNQEIFGVLDYMPEGKSPLLCLREIINFLRLAVGYSQPGSESFSPAVGRWNALLDRAAKIPPDWGAVQERFSRESIRVRPILTGPGYPTMFEKLKQTWPGGSPPQKARVLSPFFDPPETENRPAKKLCNLLQQRGKASAIYYVMADEVPGEKTLFVHAPESLRQTGCQGSAEFHRIILEENRQLHAKGIWLQGNSWSVYMMGSSNFTSPGLGLTKHANLEANLAYVVNQKSNAQAFKRLDESFPRGEWIDPDRPLKWQPVTDESLSNSDEPVLPTAFSSIVLSNDSEQNVALTLTFAGTPPTAWIIKADEDDNFRFNEADWQKRGQPLTVTLPWNAALLPSGFWVQWQGSQGRAWWPVNVESALSLPPPQELKDLPLEVLITILTSARPLYRILGNDCKQNGDHGGQPVIIDPHKQVDTSQFLLQRTRRVSWALNALRERIEKPVKTMESLQWRLHGPVGVMALASALERETNSSQEEKAFILSELALELSRVNPRPAPGCIMPNEICREVRKLVDVLRSRISSYSLEKVDDLRGYIECVFESIGK